MEPLKDLLGLLLFTLAAAFCAREVVRALMTGRVRSAEKHDHREFAFAQHPFRFLLHFSAWALFCSGSGGVLAYAALELLGVPDPAAVAATVLGALWVALLAIAFLLRGPARPRRARGLPQVDREDPLPEGLGRLRARLDGQLDQRGRRLRAEWLARPVTVELETNRDPLERARLTLSLETRSEQPRTTVSPHDLLATDAWPARLADPEVRRHATRLLQRPGVTLLELDATLRLTIRRSAHDWSKDVRGRPPPGTRSEHDVCDRIALALRDALNDLERLADALERAQPEAGPEVQLQARAPDDTRCPYCRDGIEEDACACSDCGTPHHAACWRESGRCTVLGCRGQARPAPRKRAR